MSEIRVNTIVAAEGTSAPTLPYGVQIPTGMGITGAGGLDITGIVTATFGGNVNTGLAATFGGITNISNTTASTSTTTGALIVAGGLAVGADVFIGAGLSVGGTLTYEDATNIDSVGLITAQSGIRVPGGEVTVGVAFSVGHAGVTTAAGFVGPLTGTASNATNVTVADESSDTTCFPLFATAATGDLPPKSGSNLTFNSSTGLLSATLLGGTVNTAAQTSITSVGTLAGLTVGSAGEFKVGTALTMASTSGVATFSNEVWFNNPADGAKYARWRPSQDRFELQDNTQICFGDAEDLKIYHNGSHSFIDDAGTGNLYIRAGTDNGITLNTNAGVILYYDNAIKFQTTNDGTVTTGIGTFTAGANFDGILSEKFNTVAGKLSDNTTIDLEDGMIHYFSTQETTTCTPNIRYSSSKSLNNMLSIGDAISVTVITTAAAGGYSANWTIDSGSRTEEWVGGSAPSAGGSDGLDIYGITILKTGNGTYKFIANLTNAT